MYAALACFIWKTTPVGNLTGVESPAQAMKKHKQNVLACITSRANLTETGPSNRADVDGLDLLVWFPEDSFAGQSRPCNCSA